MNKLFELEDIVQHNASDVSNINRSNNFDLLRLIAASMVLITHSYALGGFGSDPLGIISKEYSFGGVGVVMFFVISGFLVTSSLKQSKNILHFFKKRALRIYPALIVLTLITIIICGFYLTTLNPNDYFKNPITLKYIWNATLIKNEYYLPGVFENNLFSNAVNGSLWTLPLEAKCYLFLGLIGIIPTKFEYKIFAIFFITFANMFEPILIEGFNEKSKTFLGTNFEAAKCYYAFGFGSLYLILRERVKPYIFYLIIISFFISFAPNYVGKFFFYNMFCALTLYIAIDVKLPKLPKNLGDVSYGIYLYAFVVQQALAHYGINKHGIFIYTLLCALITLAFSIFSWNLVEKPALKLK